MNTKLTYADLHAQALLLADSPDPEQFHRVSVSSDEETWLETMAKLVEDKLNSSEVTAEDLALQPEDSQFFTLALNRMGAAEFGSNPTIANPSVEHDPNLLGYDNGYRAFSEVVNFFIDELAVDTVREEPCKSPNAGSSPECLEGSFFWFKTCYTLPACVLLYLGCDIGRDRMNFGVCRLSNDFCICKEKDVSISKLLILLSIALIFLGGGAAAAGIRVLIRQITQRGAVIAVP